MEIVTVLLPWLFSLASAGQYLFFGVSDIMSAYVAKVTLGEII